MSLVMTDVGSTIGMDNTMTTGIVIGVIGMLMAIVNYQFTRAYLTAAAAKSTQIKSSLSAIIL